MSSAFSSDACTTDCTGDANEDCGGRDAISVYDNTGEKEGGGGRETESERD